MKKLLWILVLGLLLSSNVGFSKGISGTQLLCENQSNNPVGLWFLSEVLVLEYTIRSWEVQKYEKEVSVKPDRIHIQYGATIDRDTLRYLGTEYYDCSIVKDFNFEEYFNKLLKDQIAEQEAKNKL